MGHAMWKDHDLEYLRRELLRRFKEHPPGTWPRPLLCAVIAVVDLGFEGPDRDVAELGHDGRPRLRLVKR